MAPPFTLKTLEGEQVSMDDLAGSVVVIDFWARWCGPCRRGLPGLQKFHEWAQASGKPIKVLAIDTFEREKTPEEIKTKSAGYWTSQKFTIPCLLDLDSAIVQTYGFRGIPATVVIDPEGRIAKIHNGYDPKMEEKLKREVNAILGLDGA